MQPAQYGAHSNVSNVQAMVGLLICCARMRRIRNARTQAHTRTPAIVVCNPLSKNRSQVCFRQGNQPIDDEHDVAIMPQCPGVSSRHCATRDSAEHTVRGQRAKGENSNLGRDEIAGLSQQAPEASQRKPLALPAGCVEAAASLRRELELFDWRCRVTFDANPHPWLAESARPPHRSATASARSRSAWQRWPTAPVLVLLVRKVLRRGEVTIREHATQFLLLCGARVSQP